VAQEPVAQEPVAQEPVVEEPVVEEVRPAPVRAPAVPVPAAVARAAPTPASEARTTSVPPPTRRRPSLAAVGRTFVVLILMTAVAAVGIRLVRQDPSDSGSLSARPGLAPPVALPVGSAYVRSTVLPDGRLRVTHWFHIRRFVDELHLHLPKVPGLTPGALSVHDVVAVADGHRVYAPRSITGGDATVYVPGAHHVVLRYVLDGAVERTEPPAGRALARVVAIDVRDGHSTTRSRTAVVGARVLALACTAPQRDALPLPCGSVSGTAWSVDLTGRHVRERVMAQLDLG
jgi:hypothetical protein